MAVTLVSLVSVLMLMAMRLVMSSRSILIPTVHKMRPAVTSLDDGGLLLPGRVLNRMDLATVFTVSVTMLTALQ